MVMYPYILETLEMPEAVQGNEGGWTSGTGEWKEHSSCRHAFGTNKQVRGEDGSWVAVSFIVYCPQGTDQVDQGTMIRVKSGDTVKAEGKALFSFKGRLNTRVWV